MASKWHRIVPKIIKGILNEYQFLTSKGFMSVEEEDVIKLSDPTPHSKSMIEYNPDFIIKRNISRNTYYYVVFEIISDQPDTKTMADISRVLASREIKRAIFLSTNKHKKKETDRLVNTLTGLYKKRFKKTEKDDVIDIISEEIFSSDTDEKIKSIIIKYLKDLMPNKK